MDSTKIELVRKRHRRKNRWYCSCGNSWPCDVIVVLDEFDELCSRNIPGGFLLPLLFSKKAVAVQNQKNGRELARARGAYAGDGAPHFGVTVVRSGNGKALAPDQAEQEAVIAMRELREDGRSYRDIAAEMNARGITGKRGGPWHAMSVQRVLSRT